MVTIDCPPQILVFSHNRKGLISNTEGGVVDSFFYLCKKTKKFNAELQTNVLLCFVQKQILSYVFPRPEKK